MLALLGDEAGEPDPVLDPQVLGELQQRLVPPALPGHHQLDGGQFQGQQGGRAQRELHPLVRHQPAQHHQARMRGTRHRRPGDLGCPVVHDGDPVPVHAEAGELVAGRLGDGDVLTAPVDPDGQHRLDPPADPGDPRAEHHRPLLPVHVVDQHDHRPPGVESAEERHAVADVYDHIRSAEPAAGQRPDAEKTDQVGESGHQVDGVPSAPADDAYTAGGGLLRRGDAVGLAEQGHAVTATHQFGGDPVEVELGAPTLGVLGVPPVQEQDVTAAGIRHGLLCHPY